jgi:hypothetical protein
MFTDYCLSEMRVFNFLGRLKNTVSFQILHFRKLGPCLVRQLVNLLTIYTFKDNPKKALVFNFKSY